MFRVRLYNCRMHVLVDGLLTTYERSGEGKAVLLLHGWGDRAAGLRSIQTALSRQFMVITPDLPGFGGTEAPKTSWDVTDYAQFVSHFLEKIDAGSTYAIIAHSNGGAIAVRGLGKNMLQADRLVLLASAGVRGGYNGRHKVQRLVIKAGKALATPLPAGAKRRLRRKVYDTVGSDMLVAEHLQETFKRVVTDDVQADAGNITIPVLLLYGERDKATPVSYGELFHERMSASTLEVLPGAGHFLYLDRPHETIKAIKDFLQ